MILRKASKLIFLLLIVSCDSRGPSEDLNRFETAVEVDAGSYQGSIATSGESDIYSFELDRVAVVDISIDPVPDDQTLILKLYDVNKQRISDSVLGDSLGPGNGLAAKLTTLVLKAEKYFIEIYQEGGAETSTQEYTLNLEVDLRDRYEFNESIEDAADIALGQSFVATLRMPHDVDFYALELNQRADLEILVNLPSDVELVNIVFYLDGVPQHFSGWAKRGSVQYYNQAAVRPGVHHIAITCRNNCTSQEVYRLQVNAD